MNTISKSIEASVAAKLEEYGVPYSVVYIGEKASPFHDELKTRMDHFAVTFKGWTTDYYTGLGHRVKPKEGSPAWLSDKVVKPTAAGVLYCLLSDAEAVDQSFADWADNYGYNTDSIKSLKTYNACCEIGQAMRKLFTSQQHAELRALLEDY